MLTLCHSPSRKHINALAAESAGVLRGRYKKLTGHNEFSDTALREGLSKKPRASPGLLLQLTFSRGTEVIARSYITSNLEAISQGYLKASSQSEAFYLSKLAILELCGWIEESMDDVVLRCRGPTLEECGQLQILQGHSRRENLRF